MIQNSLYLKKTSLTCPKAMGRQSDRFAGDGSNALYQTKSHPSQFLSSLDWSALVHDVLANALPLEHMHGLVNLLLPSTHCCRLHDRG